MYWRLPDGTKRSQVFDGSKIRHPKRAANAKKAEVEDSRRRGTEADLAGAQILFLTFADEWAGVQDWKQATRDMWPTRRKCLARHVGERTTLGEIDQLRLLAIRGELAQRYARSTVAGTMHLIMAILRCAAATGRIARDPTANVKAAPKRRADDRSGRLTPEAVPTYPQARSILDAAGDGYRAVHALGLAGLRIGEALGLELSHVTVGDQVTVTVDQQLTSLRGVGQVLTTPKTEKTRTIVVPDLVAGELRRHIEAGYGGTWSDPEGAAHHLLFVRNGRPLGQRDFAAASWSPALTAAGLAGRFTFHGYRHLVASQLLAEGAPLPAVAGYLGDHTYTVIRVYAHWLRDHHRLPTAILNRAFAADPVPARGDSALVVGDTDLG